MVISYIPQRGDIINTNFDPVMGFEQAHDRPALVLSTDKFNEHCKLVLVAPITHTARSSHFEVIIDTDKTKGVVMSNQVRMIDVSARGFSLRDKAPGDVLSHTLAKVRAILA